MDMQQHGQQRRPPRRAAAAIAAPTQPPNLSNSHPHWRDSMATLGRNEVAAWRHMLTHPLSLILPLVMAVGVLLVAQLPLSYTFAVGQEDGYGGDLPHLRGFNTAERGEQGPQRWTRDAARITMPGLGQRPVTVALEFLPISPRIYEIGPRTISLEAHGQPVAELPVRPTGGVFYVYVPAQLLTGGTLDLLLRTATFVPDDPNDPRKLGTPLSRITVQATGTGFVRPDLGALLGWMLAAVLGWASVLRAGVLVGGLRTRRILTGVAFAGVGLVVLAAWLDPPRWAHGAQPALIAAGGAYLLVVLLPAPLRQFAARLHIPLDQRTLGLLVLIVALAFGTRYGGRLYPDAMHGDIYFHTNRFNEVVSGKLYLISRHRGVDFPYPPANYLAVAPLAILHPDPLWLFPFSVALTDALSALLIFFIVARVGAIGSHPLPPHASNAPPPTHWYLPVALLATATYTFAPAFQMMLWWLFSTHIYTQAATLLLMAVLIELSVRCLAEPVPQIRTPLGWLIGLLALLTFVFLGHFGFFINVTLLGGLALLLVLPLAWRGVAAARVARAPLLLAGVGSIVLALALFYTVYSGLLYAHAQTATDSGGVAAVARREPITRGQLWQATWHTGLILHYGFFPVLLTPIGLLAIARLGRPAWGLLGLMLGTLLVSTVFGVLPFITLATHSTRWLMFSAWVVAICSAFAGHWLWHYGWSGRVAVLAMGGFVLWTTAYYWITPMLWRIRPPEPF